MPSLLDLPLELREIIIEYALCTSRVPPTYPSTAEERAPSYDVDHVVSSCDIDYTALRENLGYVNNPKFIKYEKKQLGILNSLLFVNHQLAEETKRVLHRLQLGASYALDVMLINDYKLWPTWLSVPILAQHVDELTVTVRIFGHCLGAEEGQEVRGNGINVPPVLFWCFYSLLERFLKRGPVGVCKTPSDDKCIVVDKLIMNVESHSETEYKFPPPSVCYCDWAWGIQDWFCLCPDLTEYTTRPEWLTRLLEENLQDLLEMHHLAAPYGAILYERIGSIRICLDGKTQVEYRLDEMLADLRVNPPLDPSETWEWEETLVVREVAGLPVIYPEDLELQTTAEADDGLAQV